MSKDWRVLGRCGRCGKNIYAWQEVAPEPLQDAIHKGCALKETFTERPEACPSCGGEIETTEETWDCKSCDWWQGY